MGKYVIVKHIKHPVTGKVLPVIIIDDQSEIMEFETHEEAVALKNVFQKNSDSDHTYEIKKI